MGGTRPVKISSRTLGITGSKKTLSNKLAKVIVSLFAMYLMSFIGKCFENE